MTETTTKATETAATETKAPKAKDFTAYATKTPTSLHVHYAAWLQEKTGITFPEGTDVAKITQLAVSLYHDYQASPENKARREAEQANKTPKTPSKAAAALSAAEQEIERLKAELAAAQGTSENGKQAATATGEASSKPVGRRTAAAKK